MKETSSSQFVKMNRDSIILKCTQELLTPFECLSNCISSLSDKSIDISQKKASIHMILQIIHEIPLKELIPSSDLQSIFLDHVISLPMKIANVFQGDSEGISNVLFVKIIENHSIFHDEMMLFKFMRRIFVLQNFDWLLLVESQSSLWCGFLRSLCGMEKKKLAKDILKLNSGIFVERFENILTEELIIQLLDSNSLVSLSVDDILRISQADSLKNHLWTALLKKFWSKKEFASESENSHFECICKFIFCSFSEDLFPFPQHNDHDEIIHLFISGMNFILDSKCPKRRKIAMILGEGVTKAAKKAFGEKAVNFDLDPLDEEVVKWRKLLHHKNHHHNNSQSNGISCSSMPISSSICIPSEEELISQLASLKVKPPIFIGELTELLQQKKGGSTSIQTVFSYGPEMVAKCDKTEAKDHLFKLFTQVLHLRDEFEIQDFLLHKSSLLQAIIRRETISSVTYCTHQIVGNSLSQGEKIFLLDILCDILAKEDQRDKQLKSNSTSITTYSLSTQKVRYISFTSIKNRTISQKPSEIIDPFIYRFTMHAFFSLCRMLQASGKTLPKIVFEKSILTCSFLLMHSQFLPELHQMLLEFSILIASLNLCQAGNSKWTQKVILSCYYAFACTFPQSLCKNNNDGEEHFTLFIAKCCTEIDNFLQEHHHHINTEEDEISRLAISTLQEFASEL